MNVKNLRIGNWVLYNGYPFKIESGEELDKLIRGDGNPEPIPITLEILRGMGFEMKCFSALTSPYLELIGPDESYRIKAHRDSYPGLLYEFYKNDSVGTSMIKRIEYVHDLQNALLNCEIEMEVVVLIATVDGGRNCGKTKKIQDILAEEVKRGKRCLYLSRHDQKMLRGAGHPAIDMLTYILAKEEERGYESMHGKPDYVSDILKQIKP